MTSHFVFSVAKGKRRRTEGPTTASARCIAVRQLVASSCHVPVLTSISPAVGVARSSGPRSCPIAPLTVPACLALLSGLALLVVVALYSCPTRPSLPRGSPWLPSGSRSSFEIAKGQVFDDEQGPWHEHWSVLLHPASSGPFFDTLRPSDRGM